jgi:hypothetical protein
LPRHRSSPEDEPVEIRDRHLGANETWPQLEGSLSGCWQSRKTPRRSLPTGHRLSLRSSLRSYQRLVHDTEQYANNRTECDHDRFKDRLRPMRDLKTFRSARTIIARHAFIQNLRPEATMNSGSKPGTAVFATQLRSTNSSLPSDRPG